MANVIGRVIQTEIILLPVEAAAILVDSFNPFRFASEFLSILKLNRLQQTCSKLSAIDSLDKKISHLLYCIL